MIAIDTNVLLRHLLQDDKEQALRADTLIRTNNRVLVSDVVLVETTRTLTGKRYGLDAEAVAQVVQALFEEPAIVFQDADAVWRALADFRSANATRAARAVRFADCLAVCIGKSQAAAMGEPIAGFYTFDLAAQRLTGAKPP